MKRISILIVALLAFCIIFISCEQKAGEPYGRLSVNAGTAKAIGHIPGLYDLTTITLYATYQNGDIREADLASGSCTLEEMKAGLWSIVVKGFNSDGVLTATSETKIVEIVPGEDASINLVLEYVDKGEGSFSIKVKVPAGYYDLSKASATVSSNGVEVKAFELTERLTEGDYDYFLFEDSLDSGFYLVNVELFNKEGDRITYHVETVEIASGNVSSGEIVFGADRLPTDIQLIITENEDFGYTVTVKSSNEDARFYYSIDGRDPGSNGKQYAGSFEIRVCCDLRVAATSLSGGRNEMTENVVVIGPAGGYVFYDCDADNDNSNPDNLISTECGWRYLEAAPADVRAVNDAPTVDATAEGYAEAQFGYPFGLYRMTDDGDNIYLDGEETYKEYNYELRLIGRGHEGYLRAINAMGEAAYSLTTGSEKTPNYAARLCRDLVHGEKNDWFLPSYYETMEMNKVLQNRNVGNFSSSKYWSSTEQGLFAMYENGLTSEEMKEVYVGGDSTGGTKGGSSAFAYDFGSNARGYSSKSDWLRVRPCRRFL